MVDNKSLPRDYYTDRDNHPLASWWVSSFVFYFRVIVFLIHMVGLLAFIGFFFIILFFVSDCPDYYVQGISIKNLNLSSTSLFSPEFDVTFSSRNPNSNSGIHYYQKGSSINLYYSNVKLCDGVWPEFHQPSKNVTVVKTTLKGSDIVLGDTIYEEMMKEQSKGEITFRLKLTLPVKFKKGAIKFWEILGTFYIRVDKLTAESKIVWVDSDYWKLY